MNLLKVKAFRKRPNSDDDDDDENKPLLEPYSNRHVDLLQNGTGPTSGKDSTIKSKASSLIANWKAGKDEKAYKWVVFNRPLPRPTSGNRHPHVTKYFKDLVHFGRHTICRCDTPTVHGDAFTRRHHGEAVNKIIFLSAPTPTAPSRPLTWEEAMNALLDAVGVDIRGCSGWHQEDQNLLRKVYAESTVKDILKYREVWQGVMKMHGNVKCMLENDVVWWGKKNPKDVPLATGDMYGIGYPSYVSSYLPIVLSGASPGHSLTPLKDSSRCGGGQPLSIHGPFYSQVSLNNAPPSPDNEEAGEPMFYAL